MASTQLQTEILSLTTLPPPPRFQPRDHCDIFACYRNWNSPVTIHDRDCKLDKIYQQVELMLQQRRRSANPILRRALSHRLEELVSLLYRAIPALLYPTTPENPEVGTIIVKEKYFSEKFFDEHKAAIIAAPPQISKERLRQYLKEKDEYERWLRSGAPTAATPGMRMVGTDDPTVDVIVEDWESHKDKGKATYNMPPPQKKRRPNEHQPASPQPENTTETAPVAR